MFEAIEEELRRIRRMVELADESFLLYLIDIAIIEAQARADNLSLRLFEVEPEDCSRRELAH
jgi:hypothetical protein